MTVIDAFADKQTVMLAEKTVVVEYGWCGFNADALMGALCKLNLSHFSACIYGSGLEAQSDLLKKIAEIVPVLGNTAEAVAILKNAPSFFAFLGQLSIVHPAWFEILPAHCDVNGYLKKFSGGCGGTHITVATNHEAELSNGEYYQQQLNGRSISLLFIANGTRVKVVGFNELWLNPSEEMPFRYGGAVSNVVLVQGVCQQLINAAEKLTLALGLLGLNSLDAIVREDVVYVLEVNPRLTATVDLYEDTQQNLLNQHMQACLIGTLPSLEEADWQHVSTQRSKAHAIVYAPKDIEMAATFDWPSWVVDTPFHPMQVKKIPTGAPICTVLAYADEAETAKQLAYARVEMVQKLLQS